jgi:hypothetical protein
MRHIVCVVSEQFRNDSVVECLPESVNAVHHNVFKKIEGLPEEVLSDRMTFYDY